LVLCFAPAGAALPYLAFADDIFADGTFSPGKQINPFKIQSGPISDVRSQCAACGYPGQALSTVFTLTANGSTTSDLDMVFSTQALSIRHPARALSGRLMLR